MADSKSILIDTVIGKSTIVQTIDLVTEDEMKIALETGEIRGPLSTQ